MTQPKSAGKFSNYSWIIALLFFSYILHFALLLILFKGDVVTPLLKSYNLNVIIFIRAYIFGAIGSTMFCSFFIAKDKEINELEEIKTHPDPKELRWPNRYDGSFYVLRIISGGLLGFIAMVLYTKGILVLITEKSNSSTTANTVISYVIAFLVGYYQHKFIVYLNKFMKKMLEEEKQESKQKEGTTDGDGLPVVHDTPDPAQVDAEKAPQVPPPATSPATSTATPTPVAPTTTEPHSKEG